MRKKTKDRYRFANEDKGFDIFFCYLGLGIRYLRLGIRYLGLGIRYLGLGIRYLGLGILANNKFQVLRTQHRDTPFEPPMFPLVSTPCFALQGSAAGVDLPAADQAAPRLSGARTMAGMREWTSPRRGG